ncbi:MAG: CPBP family intramembrane metalloprotease [Chitinophagaceae bacterium]|nr:CPBP family intramembrane metalloprotease [Chitinophagaceae bacterium]
MNTTFIIEICTDIIRFLKHPSELSKTEKSIQNKWKIFLCIFFFDVVIMVVLVVFLELLDTVFDLHLDDNYKGKEMMKTLPFWTLFPLVCFIIPFIEELIFRLHLKFHRNYLLRFLIFLSSLVGRGEQVRNFFHSFYISQYPIIFYLSTFVFAFVHVSNYELTDAILFLFPFIVLPQFIGGLFIGYIRVRYGLIMGFLLHSLNNTLFFIVMWFTERM